MRFQCSVRCLQRILFMWKNSAEDSGHYSLRPIDSDDFACVRPIFSLSHKSGAFGIPEHIFPFLGIALVAAQKMIVKSWLPEGRESLAGKL